MAVIECGKGHLYDTNTNSTCPYCNSSQQAVYFGDIPVANAGRTAPLNKQITPMSSDVSVCNDGKTMPPKDYVAHKRVYDDNKTMGLMKKSLGIDPIVGWLVCVDGVDKGRDYKLFGKINTIGRSMKMDVCIEGDDTISSENHARLSYSEKNNRFNLIPADSTNIIYLNGEEVFVPTIIKAYDIIDFGQTKLIFIPLCSDKFQWNQGKSGGDDNATI